MQLADQRARLDVQRRGLTFFGVHIFLQEYDSHSGVAPVDLALKVAQAGADLGAERLILSGVQATAEALNGVAAQLRPLEVQLAYHNHGAEFLGPRPEIETLFAETDPGLVWFLLDAGHAFRAGVDLPVFLADHAARLTGIHLRDFKGGRQVPLGQGDFPLAQVAGALQARNWSGWVLAEEEREDGSKPGVHAAGPARAALKQAFGV